VFRPATKATAFAPFRHCGVRSAAATQGRMDQFVDMRPWIAAPKPARNDGFCGDLA